MVALTSVQHAITLKHQQHACCQAPQGQHQFHGPAGVESYASHVQPVLFSMSIGPSCYGHLSPAGLFCRSSGNRSKRVGQVLMAMGQAVAARAAGLVLWLLQPVLVLLLRLVCSMSCLACHHSAAKISVNEQRDAPQVCSSLVSAHLTDCTQLELLGDLAAQ